MSMSFGVSIACAARTTALAVTMPSLRFGRRYRTVTLCGATATRWTTDDDSKRTPSFSASATWTAPSYFAPIGQIGMQLLFPQQGGRPARGTLLRACGVAGIGYGVDRGAPRSGESTPATPTSFSARPYHGSSSSYEMGQSTPTP